MLRREIKKNYDYHCQGVFSVDNDEGLFNCILLLAKLWKEQEIYFTKVSFFNVKFAKHELKAVETKYLNILDYALMSTIFQHLRHLELHNFILKGPDFDALLEVVEKKKGHLEVLDIAHNLIVDRKEQLDSDRLIDALNKTFAATGLMFAYDLDTLVDIYKYLKGENDSLKIMTSISKDNMIEGDMEEHGIFLLRYQNS